MSVNLCERSTQKSAQVAERGPCTIVSVKIWLQSKRNMTLQGERWRLSSRLQSFQTFVGSWSLPSSSPPPHPPLQSTYLWKSRQKSRPPIGSILRQICGLWICAVSACTECCTILTSVSGSESKVCAKVTGLDPIARRPLAR